MSDVPPLAVMLHDAIQQQYVRSPEDAAHQRRRLGEIAARTAVVQPTPAGAEAIDMVHGMIDYFWFGAHNSPLPRGLAVLKTSTGGTEILRDTVVVSNGIIGDAIHLMNPQGLLELRSYRIRTKYSQYPDPSSDDILQALLKQTPAYQWLQSWSSDAPDVAEQPLTTIARLGPENNERQRAVNRFGTDGQHERPGINARRFGERGATKVDHMTAPRLNTLSLASEESPQTQFENAIKAALTQYCGSKIVDISYSEEKGILIAAGSTPQTTFEVEKSTELWQKLAGYLGIPKHAHSPFDQVSTEILMFAVLDYYRTKPQAPDDMPEANLNVFQAEDQLSQQTMLAGFSQKRTRLEALGLVKHPPAGRSYTLSLPKVNVPNPLHVTPVVNVSAEEYMQKSNQGRLERRDKYYGQERMLQFMPPNPDLPARPPEPAGLVFRASSTAMDPYFAGYNLIAADRTKGRYYFAYTPNNDPHTPCLTPLEAAAVERAAAGQEKRGRYEVARRLQHVGETLTMTGLVQAIAAANTYALSPQTETFKSAEEAAAAMTADGRLQASCAVQNAAGIEVLLAAQPEAIVQLISGVVETSSGAFDRHHAQVLYCDPVTGRRHIFDFTPPVPGVRSILLDAADLLPRKLGQKIAAWVLPPQQPALVDTEDIEPEPSMPLLPPSSSQAAEGALEAQSGPINKDTRAARLITDELLANLSGQLGKPGEPIGADHVLRHVQALPGGLQGPVAIALGAFMEAMAAHEAGRPIPKDRLAEVRIYLNELAELPHGYPVRGPAKAYVGRKELLTTLSDGLSRAELLY